MNIDLQRYVCMGIFLGALFVASGVQAQSDSAAALEAARSEALERICRGQRLEGAEYLLKTLRDVPPERLDLVEPALGVVQLLLFHHEYLMTDFEREAFYAETLNEKEIDIDRFIATLMRYSDDAGISSEEAAKCVQDLFSVMRSEHVIPRIGSLFIMANPYYFYDSKLVPQAREQLELHFPGHPLTAEAQRLALYRAHRQGVDGLRATFEAEGGDEGLRRDSARLRNDYVGQALYSVLKGGVGSRMACVDALTSAAASAPGWAEEYAALNIMRGFTGGEEGVQVRAAATAAIERNTDSRAVYRARCLRLDVAQKQADVGTMVLDAGALLETNPMPVVPERNNYEELKNGVRHTAARLVELGHATQARALLERLLARFPNTVLAEQVTTEIAALPAVEQ